MLTGGCACGRTRYEIDAAPFDVCLCHCADCRRVAGAPVVGWFSVTGTGFRFTAGEPKRFALSPKAVRGFCPDCGTGLTYQSHTTPDVLDVTTGSLDHPEALPPMDQVFCREKLPWLDVAGLPMHEGTRPG